MTTLLPRAFTSYFRWIRCCLRYRGVSIAQGCVIAGECTFDNPVKLYPDACLRSCHIGAFTYVGDGALLINATIGRFCSIAPASIIGGYTHPIYNWASSSPVFYSPLRQCGVSFAERQLFDDSAPVVLGNDVWVGYRAIIRAGVRIGHGAAIGAGSVVTRHVEPYSVVAGTPARTIRMRFSQEVVEQLLEKEWWLRDPGWLQSHHRDFEDVSRLIELLDRRP